MVTALVTFLALFLIAHSLVTFARLIRGERRSRAYALTLRSIEFPAYAEQVMLVSDIGRLEQRQLLAHDESLVVQ